MLDESKNMMTPEILEQARKFANGGQGTQILKEMQRRGVDTNGIRDQVMDQQKLMREMLATKPNKTVILITSSRKLKVKTVMLDSIELNAKHLVKSEHAIELPCSRLATGSLTGKTIKIWYNPAQGSKNKRASKIAGFPVGGDLLIIMDGANLTEQDFLEAEKLLV